MKKLKKKYVCQECGHMTLQWQGKCSSCNSWNSFEEEHSNSSKENDRSLKKVKLISEVKITKRQRYKTKEPELERVLGGGLTTGSVTLLGGAPGVGKSTLVLQVCRGLLKASKGLKILYVSGEETQAQVAQRAKRLNVTEDGFYILNETNWKDIEQILKSLKPDVLVLDSIQTTRSSDIAANAGSPSQVKEVVNELINYTKPANITTLIIGHVTKEGGFAGPKLLEHMVDTVLYFEKSLNETYRFLRCQKNRYGSTQEIGIFKMNSCGLESLENTSECFIDEQNDFDYGRCLTCICEGNRPIVLELQALTVENKFGAGKRISEGIDLSRLSMLLALIEKYFSLPISFVDTYFNVLKGMKIKDRSCDLSIISTILSSYWKKPVPIKSTFIGEVGLNGRIRSVDNIEHRLKRLEKLGIRNVYLDLKTAKSMNKDFKLNLIGLEQIKQLEDVYIDKRQDSLA